MTTILPTEQFILSGRYIMVALLVLAGGCGLWGILNLCAPGPRWRRTGLLFLLVINAVFLAGFFLICRLHYQIHCRLPLELPHEVVGWLNGQLAALNGRSAYGLPMYDPASPPRYSIPVWIENEKYYFWFMAYAIMALIAHVRIQKHRLQAVINLFLALQVIILFLAADPFNNPLPKFFAEITPWFSPDRQAPMSRVGLFMSLYPRMIFYYNAHYMWLHPPLLFVAYACITLTFAASIFMMTGKREPAIELLGYDFAKFGYLLLTLGMLLGYPWALKAWGPNWWWDPKILSSIMMWAVYTAYLHTRLYANKPAMWYFSSILGIVCFLAMIFTFITSFYFPGEHTS